MRLHCGEGSPCWVCVCVAGEVVAPRGPGLCTIRRGSLAGDPSDRGWNMGNVCGEVVSAAVTSLGNVRLGVVGMGVLLAGLDVR